MLLQYLDFPHAPHVSIFFGLSEFFELRFRTNIHALDNWITLSLCISLEHCHCGVAQILNRYNTKRVLLVMTLPPLLVVVQGEV